MIDLKRVYLHYNYHKILWDILSERTPEQAISHKEMPTYKQHCEFVDSCPYFDWFFITDGKLTDGPLRTYLERVLGSVYVSNQMEVGLFILNKYQGLGYGKKAMELLREKIPGKLLWNVNPKNEASIKLVESLGGKLIQWTYEIGNHS